MSNYFQKQFSSRPIRSQTLNYTGSGTVVSSGFASECWQIRVFSQVAGYWSIFESTSTVPTTAPPSGTQQPAQVPIGANLLGEYIAVSPSLLFSFSSTSTSSGFVSLVEMS
jgi:hypothetical protein